MLNRWLGWVALSIACGLLGGCDEGDEPAARVQSEWTLMFFMDADNDLEAPQMENILAAARVGGTDSVRIMMLVDRSEKGDDVDGYTERKVLDAGNWTGARLFEVDKGSLKLVEDWGNTNMGDPAALVKFVEKASSIAPAKKYGLVFGDHGSAWPGFNHDGSHGGDSMTLSELDGALKAVTDRLGRLELIHYDDCLMACVENSRTVAPYCRFMTASAELVPGDGCDYDAILKGLVAKPSMDGRELGSLVVTSFRDFYEKTSDPGRKDAAPAITMALFDSDKVSELESALKELGQAANQALQAGDREAFLKAARARSKATEYGRGSADEEGSGTVDVVDFCRLLQAQYGPGPVGSAAEKVIGAAKSAVVVAIHGTALPQSRGVSIYMPLKPDDLQGPGNSYVNTRFAAATSWDKLIAAYTKTKIADKTQPELEAVKASGNTLTLGSELSLTSKLAAEDLDEAYFTIAMPEGDETIILGQLPTDLDAAGALKETWDGRWLYIHNGDEALICPIDEIQLLDESKPDGDVVVTVPLQVRRGGKGEWIEVTGTFLLDLEGEDGVTGSLIYVFTDGDQRRELDLAKGDVIRPVFLVVGKDGTEEYVPGESKEFELTVGDPNEIGVEEQDVPVGDYLLGFRAVDLAGNAADDFVKVTVKEKR